MSVVGLKNSLALSSSTKELFVSIKDKDNTSALAMALNKVKGINGHMYVIFFTDHASNNFCRYSRDIKKIICSLSSGN
ncbi:hypothetical protein VV208B2_44350 (plasmid) [Vibrio vulnificus]|nr:hypothetical protein VV208B2_44350 [Vibrio vulnificus]BDP38401.1 hypothetical protein VA208B3_47720 [Vibrio alginolyticus]